MTTVVACNCLDFSLSIADDALLLSQQLGAYVSFSPELELDMALANISLDLLGQARTIYQHYAEIEGAGRTEDDVVMFRDPSDFHNQLLAEHPNKDFAHVVARQFLFDAYQLPLYEQLARSDCATLAGVGAKGGREAEYHLDFSRGWMIRLGDGTPVSHERMQAAVNEIWPHIGSMFALDSPTGRRWRLGVGGGPEDVRKAFEAEVRATFEEAKLATPSSTDSEPKDHLPGFDQMVDELQAVQRAMPGLQW